MVDDGLKQSATVWPLPKFYFKVEWKKNEMSFQEVSGLDVQSEEIEYRHGESPCFSELKMAGVKKYGNITMKKGLFKGDSKFWEWYQQIRLNTIKRVPITISLLDEEGKATMVWTLTNAWPTKVSGTDMKSEGKEVAIESIEIVYEGLSIENR